MKQNCIAAHVWHTLAILISVGRSAHADVLEWLWFLNSHPDTIYKLMYGDKDTFRLAFALAGNSAAYHQVPSCFHSLGSGCASAALTGTFVCHWKQPARAGSWYCNTLDGTGC